MTSPKEPAPAQPTASKNPLAKLPRWLRLLMFAFLSLLVTKAFEIVSAPETVERAVAYQEQALASLRTVSPASTLLLFRDSIGLDEKGKWQSYAYYSTADQKCAKAHDAALVSWLEAHPGAGILKPGTHDGLAGCEGTKLSKVGDILVKGVDSCALGRLAARTARTDCMTVEVGHVEGWGRFVSSMAANSDGFSGYIVKTFQPAAALADVVWHNYLSWAPGGLYRLLLLAVGLALALWTSARMISTDTPAIMYVPIIGIYIPLVTILVTTVLAVVSYYVALVVLQILGPLLRVAIAPLVSTGGLGAWMLKETITDACKEVVGGSLKKMFKVHG